MLNGIIAPTIEWVLNTGTQSDGSNLSARKKLNNTWVKLSLSNTSYVFYFHFTSSYIYVKTHTHEPINVTIQTSLSNLFPSKNSDKSLCIEGNLHTAENFANFIKSLSLHLPLPKWLPSECEYVFQRFQHIIIEHFKYAYENTPSNFAENISNFQYTPTSQDLKQFCQKAGDLSPSIDKIKSYLQNPKDTAK